MTDTTNTALTITDANGKIKVFRNILHRFGASNPFTLGIICLVVGNVAGCVSHL